ncbi:hypothetical protein PG994_013599 [Apiospora phragmitis]|uniref:F-box domain-containing protein n=1 Tax=Apiospora phragmitis TaxID=2905665 RepID=A0ABR1TAV4_9PEZI
MDGFSNIPLEIARLIMVQAVKVRKIRRAVRFSFVHRSWDREVTEAIIESGILDGLPELEDSPFWPKYLMHKILCTHTPLPRSIRIIRLAAERVLAFRGGKTSSDDHDALRQYLWEICQLFPRRQRYEWFTLPEQIGPMQDSDEDFKRALLAAAAATNDLALVKQLPPNQEECTHLIRPYWVGPPEPK